MVNQAFNNISCQGRVCLFKGLTGGILYIVNDAKKKSKWLFARLPHMKCIRLGFVCSSHLPLKMHKVRSSPCICANDDVLI